MSQPDGGHPAVEDRALQIYRVMVAHPQWSLATISGHLDLDESDLTDDVATLVGMGLLSRNPLPEVTLAAVSPGIGVALMAERAIWEVQQRATELDRATRDLTRLLLEIARPDDHPPQDVVLPDSLAAQLELMTRQCHSERAAFLTASSTEATWSAELPVQHLLDAAHRGVGVSVLVEEEVAEQGWVLETRAALGDRAQWRKTAALPVGMVIFDRRAAVLLSGDAGPASAGVVVRQEATVAALAALFDAMWQPAVAIGTEAVGTEGVEPPGAAAVGTEGMTTAAAGSRTAHVQLARLLASGAKDESVARHLGLSVRSLSRLVAELSDELGAGSRFQAGVSASRRGWV